MSAEYVGRAWTRRRPAAAKEAKGLLGAVPVSTSRLDRVPIGSVSPRVREVLRDEYFNNMVVNRIYNVEWILGEIETVDRGGGPAGPPELNPVPPTQERRK